ncbi:MAG TPA: sensor histidine kinase, partial [Candidatus Dormibacteraeota bacterium]
IALAYAGLAALLGLAAGRRFPVAVAVAVTIAATTAFQPARVWLERLADRWIFGRRFGRYETVRRLGAAVDWTLGLEPLGARIASTIREAMPVAWVRIVVEQEATQRQRARVIGVDGIAAEDPLAPDATAALTVGDDEVGRIECGLKPRRSWTTSDDDLLKSLARQAAMAIRSSLLAEQLAERLEDLAASRARIVRAEDAERRRIERNIHDGIQQDMVALIANLGLARTQLVHDPSVVDASLARLQDDARSALAELRELARGIHPPVLTDRGILEAIEARIARMPLGVGFEIDRKLDGARFPGEVEAAAYFLVCEALTNAAKHAAVNDAKVRIARSDEGLLVEVVDHGRGFDPEGTQRAGLDGIADRVEALGGKFQVCSAPGDGTVVRAILPVPQSSV